MLVAVAVIMPRMTLREMQSLGREARRLFRLMDRAFPTLQAGALMSAMDLFLRDCMRHAQQPAFMLRNVKRLVRRTQRVFNLTGTCPLRTYGELLSMLHSYTRLQSGVFTSSLINPLDYSSECPICFNRRGRWWMSLSCPGPHLFHVNCILRHFQVNNGNCPLCRTEIWLNNHVN